MLHPLKFLASESLEVHPPEEIQAEGLGTILLLAVDNYNNSHEHWEIPIPMINKARTRLKLSAR
jgi:hypothetical protein